MSFVHGKVTDLLFDEYNLTRFFRMVKPKGDVDLMDATMFRSSAKQYQGGFEGGEVSCEGLFESTDPAIVGGAEYLDSIIGAAVRPVITIGPAGLDVLGNVAKMLEADETSHNVDASIEALIVTSAQFLANEGLRRGLVLAPLASYTATGNGASIDNGAATTAGAVAHLHVTAKAGTTPTIDWVVQHSVDNSVWVDLFTFTQATDVTVERLEVSGTINRYLRAIRTIGGSGGPAFTSMLSVARLREA